MPENCSLVTALILERPMCVTCLSRRAALTVEATQTVLTVIGRAVQVRRDESLPCRVCQKGGEVFYVARPAT
jgi:hypothetical protein